MRRIQDSAQYQRNTDRLASESRWPRQIRHFHGDSLFRSHAGSGRAPRRLRSADQPPKAIWTWTSTTPSRTLASRSAKPSTPRLGNKRGILRAGYFLMPMDETLAAAAVDLAAGHFASSRRNSRAKRVGDFQTELVEDFFQGFALAARANVHSARSVRPIFAPPGRSGVQGVCARVAFRSFARQAPAQRFAQHKGTICERHSSLITAREMSLR